MDRERDDWMPEAPWCKACGEMLSSDDDDPNLCDTCAWTLAMKMVRRVAVAHNEKARG